MLVMGNSEELICSSCGYSLEPFTPHDDECHKCGRDSMIEASDLINPDLTWGTYGKNGDEPLKYVKLGSCSLNHLKNILKDGLKISYQYEATIRHLIRDKEMAKLKGISSTDLPLYINEEWFDEEVLFEYKNRLSKGV